MIHIYDMNQVSCLVKFLKHIWRQKALRQQFPRKNIHCELNDINLSFSWLKKLDNPNVTT